MKTRLFVDMVESEVCCGGGKKVEGEEAAVAVAVAWPCLYAPKIGKRAH